MALQALFPLDFNKDLTKQDAIMHAIELEHHELIDEEQEHFVPVYLDQLVAGVCHSKSFKSWLENPAFIKNGRDDFTNCFVWNDLCG